MKPLLGVALAILFSAVGLAFALAMFSLVPAQPDDSMRLAEVLIGLGLLVTPVYCLALAPAVYSEERANLEANRPLEQGPDPALLAPLAQVANLLGWRLPAGAVTTGPRAIRGSRNPCSTRMAAGRRVT